MKVFLLSSCRRVYWYACEDSQLCLVCVHSSITRLQLKKMSLENVCNVLVCTWCNHFRNYLKWVLSQTPNQKQFRIFTQGTLFKGFLGKISAILRSCIVKKINLEVTCKRDCFGYWNSCKRLPNFINMAALHPWSLDSSAHNHFSLWR